MNIRSLPARILRQIRTRSTVSPTRPVDEIGDLPDHPSSDRRIPWPSPLLSDYEPRLQPLLISGIGRSGTTLLMRLLMQDGRIVVHRYYTHEIRAAGHWMLMLESYFRGSGWEGQHPLTTEVGTGVKRLVAEEYPRALATFCQQNIDRFYLELADSQQQGAPSYFAEKAVPERQTELLLELYPAGKEVFLVRDPRDMFCSMREHFRGRGYRGMGWLRGMSEEAAMRERATWVRRVMLAWRRRKDRALLVLYEDLVNDSVEQTRRLFNFIGLPLDEDDPARIVEQVNRIDAGNHRTSPSSAESVGRWRQELSLPLQSLANQIFAEALAEFGYEPS